MAAFVCVDNVLNVIEKCIGNELHIVSSENRLNLHKILTQSLLASVVIEKYVSIYVQKKLECLSSALLTFSFYAACCNCLCCYNNNNNIFIHMNIHSIQNMV